MEEQFANLNLNTSQQNYFQQNPFVLKSVQSFLDRLCNNKPENVPQFTIDHFQAQKYTPLIISGPSGAGKGTIINHLLKEYPNTFQLSVSLTTRNPRQGEEHGVHYYFVTIDEFKSEIEKNSFAEQCEVHGNYYGTHLGKLFEICHAKKIPILDIDVQGGQKIYKQFPSWNYIFLNVPSAEEQEKRLRGRGTETEEQIQRRLKNAIAEREKLSSLNYYREIINDNFDQTKRDFVSFLKETYSNVTSVFN